jgi:hypothetical protein
MVLSRAYRVALVIVGVTTSAVLWFVYAPEHWLRQVSFATVKVDGRLVQAEVYLGLPPQREAEAVALVHVPEHGDYFLDFDNETYRETSNREFIRLVRGAWTFKSMREGHFAAPLPFQNLNEFRIASSSGHIVSVQF